MTMEGARWLRSARRRPAAALAILLLSAGAVLVSAVTPMLIDAVAAATLREGVAAAALPDDGIVVTSSPLVTDIAVARNATANVLAAATGTSDRWGAPRAVLESQLTPRITAAGSDYETAPRFSVALDGCHGLRLTGRCPTSALEAALPLAIAQASGWGIGTVLEIPVPGRVDPLTVDVVGTYDETSGRGRYLADPILLSVRTVPRAVPNIVIGDGSLNVLPAAFRYVASVRVARPVRQSDVADLRRGLAAATAATLDVDAAQVGATAGSDLPGLLDSVARRQAAGTRLAAPIGLEALALAWFALGAVAQRTARARAAEWGIGRMRGVRPRAWLGAVFVEPVVAVLAGAALGFPAAVLVSRVAASAVLGRDADVDPASPPVLTAAALAVAGSLVALTAASLRAARMPLHELLGDTAEPRRATRAALVGQVALVSLAIAVGWATFTATGGGGPQLGLLLPVALALVVGLVAVRVAVVLVRRASRRAPRSLVALVVGRGLARAPSALVAAQLVLVATALGAYSLQVGSASATAQTDRAELAVGAAQVLAVRVPPGVSLLDAVRRADPSGRVALAAAELGGDTTEGTGRVVAVDTARIDAVSTWRPEWRGGADLSRLRPSGAGLTLVGSRLTVTTTALRSGDPYSLPRDPGVLLEAVLETAGSWRSVPLGTLRDGTLRGAIPCADGCRVVALALSAATTGVDVPWGARFAITAMSTDRQAAPTLQAWLDGSRWRERVVDASDSRRPASATASDAPGGGLAVSVLDAAGTSTPRLEPAVGAALVPAVAGSSTDLVPFPGVRGAVSGTSLSQSAVLLRPIARAPALPRALRDGVLVDLAQVERVADPSRSIAQQEVWLTAGAHPSVLAALRRDGIRVLDRASAADAVDAGLRAATNRSLLLAGTAALIGVLFGLLALVAARVVDMPERRREWRTLRLAGVRRRDLRRLALVQIAAPSVAGAVLGALAGSVAATLTTGRLPLLVDQAPGPPIDAAPPVVALAGLVTAVVLLVVALALAVSRVEVRDDGGPTR